MKRNLVVALLLVVLVGSVPYFFYWSKPKIERTVDKKDKIYSVIYKFNACDGKKVLLGFESNNPVRPDKNTKHINITWQLSDGKEYKGKWAKGSPEFGLALDDVELLGVIYEKQKWYERYRKPACIEGWNLSD